MKPWQHASRQLARTHPLVVNPVIISVSIPQTVSVEASDVPKNALGYCLDTTSSSSPTFKSGRPRSQRIAFEKVPQRLGLLIEATAVERLLLVDDIGVNDGHTRATSGVAHSDGGSERAVHARIQIAGRLEVGLHKIDEQQRRTFAETDPIFVHALIVSLQVHGHNADAMSFNLTPGANYANPWLKTPARSNYLSGRISSQCCFGRQDARNRGTLEVNRPVVLPNLARLVAVPGHALQS